MPKCPSDPNIIPEMASHLQCSENLGFGKLVTFTASQTHKLEDWGCECNCCKKFCSLLWATVLRRLSHGQVLFEWISVLVSWQFQTFTSTVDLIEMISFGPYKKLLAIIKIIVMNFWENCRHILNERWKMTQCTHGF